MAISVSQPPAYFSIPLNNLGNNTYTITVPVLSYWAKLTVALNGAFGSATIPTAALYRDGALIASAAGGSINLGPIIAAPNTTLTLTLSGFTGPVSGSVEGNQANVYGSLAPLDAVSTTGFSIVAGSVTLSGPINVTGTVAVSSGTVDVGNIAAGTVDINGNVTVVQPSPGQLFAGSAGTPLLDNVSYSVPASGNVVALSQQAIAGYAAMLLIVRAGSGATNVLYAEIDWLDATNNIVTTTMIGSLFPYFLYPLGAVTNKFTLTFFNQDGGAAHNLTNVTLIPLTAYPVRPSSYLTPRNNSSIFPDAKTMISISQAIASGVTDTFVANFVWPGHALLNIWLSQGNWSATVNSIDAKGNVTNIAKMSNTISQGLMSPLSLPSALTQVAVTNSATSGSSNAIIGMTATD